MNTLTPSAENRTQEEVVVQNLRKEALKQAQTVGEFQNTYERMIRAMLEGNMPKNTDGGSMHDGMVIDVARLTTVIENERKNVNIATEGNEQMRLEEMQGNVLGRNRIGAGREGAALNRAMFEHVHTNEDFLSIKQVAEHEAAHGDQVELRGELRIDHQAVDPLLILEGHAEIRGNEGIGRGMNYHREGQPEKVYEEGQRLMADIIARTSRQHVERVLTQTGDLSALQVRIDREEKAGLAPARH